MEADSFRSERLHDTGDTTMREDKLVTRFGKQEHVMDSIQIMIYSFTERRTSF